MTINLEGFNRVYTFTQELLDELYKEFDDLLARGATPVESITVVARKHDFGAGQTSVAFSQWQAHKAHQ